MVLLEFIETHGALVADYLASIKERQMSREPIPPLGGATQRVEVGLAWACRASQHDDLK